MTFSSVRLNSVNRTVPLGAAMLLAVAMLSSLAVQRVEASCGDYVLIGGSMQHAGQAESNASDEPTASGMPIPKPCSGPNCSGSPPASPIPATRIDSPQRHFFQMAERDIEPLLIGDWIALGEIGDLPRVLRPGILRPPR